MASDQNMSAEARSMEAGFESMPRKQVVIIMGCVMVGLFLAALDQTVVGTAIPRIISDLGGFDRYTWVTTSYLAASTITVPIVGRLTDLFGRKIFYLAGLILFLVGSLATGLSESMNQLIAFRALQGMGGGVLLSLAFVVVGDLFPPAERGRVQGIVAGVFGLASVVGPTLGGFITDTLSWSWIFFINLPIGAILIFLIIGFFPSITPKGEDQRIDYAGILALILTVVPLMIALSTGGVDYSWTSPVIIGMLALSALSAIVFVYVELHTENPIMPPSIYKNRVILVALLATFITGFGMFSTIIFVPLFFQAGLGFSATNSGTFLTPMMLGIVFGAGISGQIISRIEGYRVPALFGILIMSLGAFLMSRMTVDTSEFIAIGFIVTLGFGLGFTFPAFTIAVQNAVEHRLLGVATSTVQFYRTIGGSLGLALLGGLMPGLFREYLDDGLPEDIQSTLGDSVLGEISNNPSSIVDPSAVQRLEQQLEALSVPLATVMDALSKALVDAVTDIFVVTFITLTLAIVVTVFLSDRPLRTRGSDSTTVPATTFE